MDFVWLMNFSDNPQDSLELPHGIHVADPSYFGAGMDADVDAVNA